MNTATINTRIPQAVGSDSATTTATDWAALAARVAIAALFLWSGYGKLAYMAPNVGYMEAYGVPFASVLIWPALLVELIGGAMLLTGYRARFAALMLAIFTLPATFIFHAYWGVPADQVMNQQIHFMKNIAIVGGLLSVLANGAGRLSLGR